MIGPVGTIVWLYCLVALGLASLATRTPALPFTWAAVSFILLWPVSIPITTVVAWWQKRFPNQPRRPS